MSQLIRQIAVVSESPAVPYDELMRVSGAVQKQVSRDLAPAWGVAATVDAFAKLEDMPLGSWPIIVRDDIGYDARGIHLDEDGQPFALVQSSDNDGEVSLTVSHECLEMLVDPFGTRLVAGDSPKPDQGRVLFLVEVCDPSEAATYGYTVNGVLVSDFYTPAFFEPVSVKGVRYSYTGAIREPRQVLEGGYLSWMEGETRQWWQETWFGTSQSTFVKVGMISGFTGSLRSELDRRTEPGRRQAISPGFSNAKRAGLEGARVSSATSARASSLRKQIGALAYRALPSGEGGAQGLVASPSTSGDRAHRRNPPSF